MKNNFEVSVLQRFHFHPETGNTGLPEFACKNRDSEWQLTPVNLQNNKLSGLIKPLI